MARNPTVKVRFEGDSSDLRKESASGQSAVSKLFNSLKQAPLAAKAALAGIVGSFAGLVSIIGKAVDAAQVQEDAVNRLRAALQGLGPAAQESQAALEDQAAALEATTRFGDEAVISAQALLATMGVQAEQLPQATQATVDLAAALGISLESAARNVGKTVGGFAGELGEVIPELKNLSAEALRSGEGIELLANKFKGRAVEDAKTFAGALAGLRNAFGTLLEKFGAGITQSDNFKDALNRLKAVITDPNFIGSVEGIASGFNTVFQILRPLGLAIATTFQGAISVIQLTRAAVLQLTASFAASLSFLPVIGKNFLATAREIQQGANDAAAAAAKAGESTLKFGLETLRASANLLLYGTEAKKAADSTVELGEAAGGAGRNFDDLGSRLEALAGKFGTTTEEILKEDEALSDAGVSASDFAESQEQIATAARSATTALQEQERQLVVTALAFDRIAESAGRAAAVEAALAGGGRLSQGGTRIRLPGGGSRLTSSPGFGTSLSGGTFTTVRQAIVGSDGRIRWFGGEG